MSVIYHTPQHLHRLREEDWEKLQSCGFPINEAWEVGYSRDVEEVEDNDSEDLPQEQVMSVRQTSPAFSEGEVRVEEQLDVESSSALRPTL